MIRGCLQPGKLSPTCNSLDSPSPSTRFPATMNGRYGESHSTTLPRNCSDNVLFLRISALWKTISLVRDKQRNSHILRRFAFSCISEKHTYSDMFCIVEGALRLYNFVPTNETIANIQVAHHSCCKYHLLNERIIMFART